MRRRQPVVVAPRRGPGLVGTMAQTAVIAGTATVVSKSVSGAMDGKAQAKQAQQQAQIDAAVQQATFEQQQALAAQQAQLAAQQAAAQQAAAQQAPAAPAAPAPGSLDDMAAQIQKLKIMQEQGLISAEEFEAKKRLILGI